MTNTTVNTTLRMVQFSQHMAKTELIEVAGSGCRPPHRCSQCFYREVQAHPDPENKGRAYQTNACNRPERHTKALVDTWFLREVARISQLPGRVAELRPEEEKRDKKGKVIPVVGPPRFAIWVNDVRRAPDDMEVEP